MARFLLLSSTFLFAFHSSYSRPQTFFSSQAHQYTPAWAGPGKHSVENTIHTLKTQTFSQPAPRKTFNQATFRKQSSSSRKALRKSESKGSGDIIEQARSQADQLVNSLRSVMRNPDAAAIIDKVFEEESSDCINNMDQALQAIETSIQLFENAGSEVKELIQMVQEYQTIEDIPTAVRQSSKIIRLLDILLPELSPPASACKPNSNDVTDSLLTLKDIVHELSTHDDVYYTTQVRQSLASSSKILTKVTTFLEKESHFKFENFCTNDKEHVRQFFTGIGNMMGDLSDLYTSLQPSVTPDKEFKKQEDFTKKSITNIDKLSDLDLIPLDCNHPDSTNLVAESLDDLANLVEDIGMETLCGQLDLDLSDCRF